MWGATYDFPGTKLLYAGSHGSCLSSAWQVVFLPTKLICFLLPPPRGSPLGTANPVSPLPSLGTWYSHQHPRAHPPDPPYMCLSTWEFLKDSAFRSTAPTPVIGPKYQASHEWMNEWVNPRYHQFQEFHVTIETSLFPLTSPEIPKTISPIEVRGWVPHLSWLILSHPKPRSSKPHTSIDVLTLSPRVDSDFKANSNSLTLA